MGNHVIHVSIWRQPINELLVYSYFNILYCMLITHKKFEIITKLKKSKICMIYRRRQYVWKNFISFFSFFSVYIIFLQNIYIPILKYLPTIMLFLLLNIFLEIPRENFQFLKNDNNNTLVISSPLYPLFPLIPNQWCWIWHHIKNMYKTDI